MESVAVPIVTWATWNLATKETLTRKAKGFVNPAHETAWRMADGQPVWVRCCLKKKYAIASTTTAMELSIQTPKKHANVPPLVPNEVATAGRMNPYNKATAPQDFNTVS